MIPFLILVASLAAVMASAIVFEDIPAPLAIVMYMLFTVLMAWGGMHGINGNWQDWYKCSEGDNTTANTVITDCAGYYDINLPELEQ